MPSRFSAGQIAKVAGLWIASNYLWTLASGAVGFVVSAAFRGFLGIANAYLLVAVALLVAAAILAFVRPPVSRWWVERHQELAVEIDREEWDNFQHKARILEIRVKVTNRTDKRKRMTGFGLSVHGSPNTAPGSITDMDLHREVEARRSNHPLLTGISIIEPRDVAKGWMVFPFPWSTDSGPPGYSFVVRDELNVDFVARGGSSLPLPQVAEGIEELTGEIEPDPRQELLSFLKEKKEEALPIARWIEEGLEGSEYSDARGASDAWADPIFQRLLSDDKELARLFNDDAGERYSSMQPGEFLDRRFAQLDKVIAELEQRG